MFIIIHKTYHTAYISSIYNNKCNLIINQLQVYPSVAIDTISVTGATPMCSLCQGHLYKNVYQIYIGLYRAQVRGLSYLELTVSNLTIIIHIFRLRTLIGI